MKLLLGCWLVLAAVTLPVAMVSAMDGGGNYAIWGEGGRSCNQYLHASGDSGQLASYRDYVMGYLTAINTLSADTYDAVGGQSLETTLSWITDYCNGHKIESFERAITQLLVSHHEQRLRMPPGTNRGWGGSGETAAPSPAP